MFPSKRSESIRAESGEKTPDALARLPEHKDPFFAVHQGLHATMAEYFHCDQIPLPASYVARKCGQFSSCAAMSLRRLFEVSASDLFILELSTFLNGNRALTTLLDSPLDSLATDGEHTILYIRNGMALLPEKGSGDIFFDSTAGQFRRGIDPDRSERVYDYLKQHGGNEGALMAETLHNRGYVKIPQGVEGHHRLGTLLSAYRAKRAWTHEIGPVKPEDLYNSSADTTQDSYYARNYDEETSNCPHRNFEWNTYENMFPPNTVNGDLCLESQRYSIKYQEDWIRSPL